MPYSRREAITMLIRAPFATARSAIAEKRRGGSAEPSLTTSRSGPSDSVSRFVGTTDEAEAAMVTSR